MGESIYWMEINIPRRQHSCQLYWATCSRMFSWMLPVVLALTISMPLQASESPKEPNVPAHVPITGPKRPKVQWLDAVMLKYLDKIGCTGATLAISRCSGQSRCKGRLLYRRGYGWRDRDKTIPTHEDTMIGIASCDKPITAAGIRRLARQKRLQLDAKLFDVLSIQPQGPVVDKRVKNITINHLLEHKAGWGHDPRGPATEAARKAGFKGPIPIEVLLGFVMTRPLEDEPGTVSKYCNFGYDMLRHTIEKRSGKTYIEYYCTELLGFRSIKGMHGPGQPKEKYGTPLIWNDAKGGPVSASASTLCRFMERYWLTGKPRRKGNPYWVKHGSLPSSTAIMVWRSDGINIAALFNGRSKVKHNDIKKDLESIIDQLKLTVLRMRQR